MSFARGRRAKLAADFYETAARLFWVVRSGRRRAVCLFRAVVFGKRFRRPAVLRRIVRQSRQRVVRDGHYPFDRRAFDVYRRRNLSVEDASPLADNRHCLGRHFRRGRVERLSAVFVSATKIFGRKMNCPITAAIRVLREKKIEFEPHVFDYVEKGGTKHSSEILGVDEHSIIKTLIFETSEKKPLISPSRIF